MHIKRHAAWGGSRALVFAKQRAAALLWILAAVSGGGCADSGGDRAVVVRYALERVSSCEEAEGALRARVLDEMNAHIDSLKESASGRPFIPCPPPVSYPTAYSSPSSYGQSSPSPQQQASAPMPSASQAGPAPSASPPSASPSSPSAPSASAPTPSAPAANAPARAASAPASPSSSPAAAATPAPAAGDSNAAASSGAKSTSTTNNQVFGVDEADFIKNDSKYVYAALNGALRIVEAWPAEQAHEVARVSLPGTPKKLFVTQDRALVYISMPPAALASSPNSPRSNGGFSYRTTPECTYGYGCEFGGDGTATLILVFDISDRTKPKQIRRLELSGSLLAARRIGDAVHTVVVTPEVTFSGLSYYVAAVSNACGVPAVSREEVERQYEDLRAKNTEIIANAPLRQLIPSVREDGAEFAGEVCGAMYRETVPTGTAFTSLVSLDMVSGGAPAISTIVSKPGAVYASGEALYIGVNLTENQPSLRDSTHPELATAIHKFEIGPTPASDYVASGKVKGHVLNQFSMDEYEGHLRVATSWGKVPSPDVHSTLSVLAQRDLELTAVGVVDKIAPNEDIRSVRFEGERGFVVTFKKTDPLFAFDLSNPKKPRLAGELKIPGFSTYMHLLDSTHLLTIGYDAADQGNFAYFTGVLLQIFDVHDLAKPTLAHKTVIGTRGTSSEALTNHLAFNLWQDKLAVPMTICEGGGTTGTYGNNMTFSGLIVYDVSTATGLTERGRVAHPGANGAYNSASCNNWWTNASSNVERSIFMDEFVYSIARDVMRVQDLEAMGTDVSSVSFVP